MEERTQTLIKYVSNKRFKYYNFILLILKIYKFKNF